jgi:hypothetical protein
MTEIFRRCGRAPLPLALSLIALVAVPLAPLASAHEENQACTAAYEASTGEDCTTDAEIAMYDDSAAEGAADVEAKGMRLVANRPKTGVLKSTNSDLAFWGDYALQGNFDGLQITDIRNPSAPRVVSQLRCPDAQNDVSVWGTLAFLSVDIELTDDSCESTPSSALLPVDDYWEGVRVVDWSNPRAPRVIANVETDCGSHTHTLLPQVKQGRVLLYVSSYSPSPQYKDCLPPHDKISVIEVPLATPAAAKVIAEPVLFDALGTTDGKARSEASTSGCHDITVYPSRNLAAGACMGQGVLLDITDPVAPKVLSSITDPNFAFWHSATFSNDGSKVIFTDEKGGGGGPECNATVGPTKGADAIYDVSDPAAPVFKSYFKIPRMQTNEENCVAHNGVVLPVPGRDLFVQAWYQGGVTLFDFTNPAKPVELAYYDRGPLDRTKLVSGGAWSAYWYRGRIWVNEMARGFDVLAVSPALVGSAASVREPYLNAQSQEPLRARR